jgi:hypothetical protein
MLARCEVLMYVNVEMTGFCHMTPCNFVSEGIDVSIFRVCDGED